MNPGTRVSWPDNGRTRSGIVTSSEDGRLIVSCSDEGATTVIPPDLPGLVVQPAGKRRSTPVARTTEPIPAQQLSAGEQLDLERCEATIERGRRTFLEVGQAIIEIRDRRLYRGTHATFEEYCRERWEFSASRARQLISSVGVLNDLQGGETVTRVTPESEKQVRPLARLEPEERREAWNRAVERAGGEQPTAPEVARAAAEVAPPVPAGPPVGTPVWWDEDGNAMSGVVEAHYGGSVMVRVGSTLVALDPACIHEGHIPVPPPSPAPAPVAPVPSPLPGIAPAGSTGPVCLGCEQHAPGDPKERAAAGWRSEGYGWRCPACCEDADRWEAQSDRVAAALEILHAAGVEEDIAELVGQALHQESLLLHAGEREHAPLLEFVLAGRQK